MESNNSQCPYCRETVAAGALRCKHCLSEIDLLARAEHGGICPCCKERVHAEATMCKHCKTWIGAVREIRLQSLGGSDGGGCGCNGGGKASPDGVGIALGIAGTGTAMILRRPGLGGFGGFGGFGNLGDGTNVDCLCWRDCKTVDGKTTCGPWNCKGPPGCLDLPK